MVNYANSSASNISRLVERSTRSLSGAIINGADKISGALEAVSSGLDIQQYQVFQIAPASGTTVEETNFSPEFHINEVREGGTFIGTVKYPAHANNGAGTAFFEREIEFQPSTSDAQRIINALDNGASLEDCVALSGWTLDGTPFDQPYARGSELQRMQAKIVYSGEEGRFAHQTGVTKVFNLAASAGPSLLVSLAKTNLQAYIEAEMEPTPFRLPELSMA